MRNQECKDLSQDLKARVAQFLILHTEDGEKGHKANQAAADHFQISTRSVGRIWAETRKLLSEGTVVSFTNKHVTEHTKLKSDLKVINLSNLPHRKRRSYRRIAKHLGVSKSLVGNWLKDKRIKPHTNAIKPQLTQQNKLLRLYYCLSSLQFDSQNNILKFKGMHNVVHIDEKWFFIIKTCDRYYLLPGEDDPYRSCKSKMFITKIMFMAALSRPMYGSHGELLFDGKIGLFPFTKTEAAMRNSKNRVRGTLETKSIEAVTKEVIKDYLINKIVPAIKAKWPANMSKDILIQQDNAKPHIKNDDIEFREAASLDGFNIQLLCQPPNSPDTNINDLGFFRAIQSLQEETSSANIDDLVTNVHAAYDELTHVTLNKVFISLQGCMVEIMKCKGENRYKIPYFNKERLIREGQLPESIEVEKELLQGIIQFLQQPENQVEHMYEVGGLFEDLGY